MIDPLSLGPITFDRPAIQVPRPVLPTRRLLQPTSVPGEFILETDYSSLSNYMECPRMYENYSIHSREASVDTPATNFGKLFHTCEEYRLRHGYSPETLAAQRDIIEQHYLTTVYPPSDYRSAARMNSVLAAYYAINAFDGWPERIVKVNDEPLIERPYKVPLMTVEVNARVPYAAGALIVPNLTLPENHVDENEYGFFVSRIHVVLTGRIDAVVAEGPLLWVIDHKTTSRGGKEFEEYFRLSNQTRGYTWAASKLTGLPLAGLILNAVIIRPPTKTGVATEFDRKSYPYRPDSLEEYEANMRQLIRTIIFSLTSGYFQQHSLSFKSPCVGCAYHDNCQLPVNQRWADLASDFYQDVTWSPLH